MGNGATHLPPIEVFYLLVFTSVLQCVGAWWLLEVVIRLLTMVDQLCFQEYLKRFTLSFSPKNSL